MTSPLRPAPAPCDPENVVASLDCQSGVATVTWTAGMGDIVYYIVLAQAQAPGQPTISVRVNTTSAALDQLQCGEVYDVLVLAGDGNCNSSLHASTTINTGKDLLGSWLGVSVCLCVCVCVCARLRVCIDCLT